MDGYQTNLRGDLRQLEAERIEEALSLTDWNKTHASRLLGIPRPTLIAKMHRLGISLDRPEGVPHGTSKLNHD